MGHNCCDIIGLAWNEWGHIVSFDMTNGDYMEVRAKPFLIFVTSSKDELLKYVMGKAKYVSEVHDLGRIGLSELNTDLAFKFYAHF